MIILGEINTRRTPLHTTRVQALIFSDSNKLLIFKYSSQLKTLKTRKTSSQNDAAASTKSHVPRDCSGELDIILITSRDRGLYSVLNVSVGGADYILSHCYNTISLDIVVSEIKKFKFDQALTQPGYHPLSSNVNDIASF